MMKAVPVGPILLLTLSLLVHLVPNASAQPPAPAVHVVLFTHIEDNTPAGTLGSPQSRQHYLSVRSKLIVMANLARDYGVPWSLQPDWKILEAALIYEDSVLVETTGGKNVLRYLKEDLGAVIDPHSHEHSGYNYTDVAHLLNLLGVGGSTVIGGHVWDPDLPQFQQWDRFRVPVQGEHYPEAWWRGDILMGSGTPNHVNDPVVSGVWQPLDRDHYFVHDPSANIAAVGQYTGDIEDIPALADLYQGGGVGTDCMLTLSYHISPATITGPGGIALIEDTVIRPLVAMRNDGIAELTDFTTLVATWQAEFGGQGCIYDPESTTAVAIGAGGSLRMQVSPNPFNPRTVITFELPQAGAVDVAIYDLRGRRVRELWRGERTAGSHEVIWDGEDDAHRAQPAGVYMVRLWSGDTTVTRAVSLAR